MNKKEKLQQEIKSLSTKIKEGKYSGEKYQLAVDMLKTKKDEYIRLLDKENAKLEPITDPPIKGLTEPEKKTSTKMSGGFKSII